MKKNWSKNVLALSVWAAASVYGGGASAAIVGAADVVPAATFDWGTNGPDKWGQVGIQGSGAVAVTADFPNQSNGSMRLDLPATSDKAGLA